MFESDDFDLDEDFLKDIGEKEEEYYSQKIDLEKQSDPPAKRQKTVILEPDLLGEITFDDEPDFAKNTPKPVTTIPKASEPECANVASRKKIVLELFKTNTESIQSENVSQQKLQFSRANPVSQKSPESSLPNEKLETLRKTLALEILRKGSLDKNPKNFNFSPPKSNNEQKKSSVVEKNSRNVDYSEEIGRNSPVEAFKKPAERSSKSPVKFATKNSPKFPSRDSTKLASRMTLIRKFPGPAGLLPDSPESNLDHANFLNGLDNREVNENLEDSEISEYCSQNTERLFSSGAWRSMLNDLPANFLKGHEIATIKRSKRDLRENSRAPFIAGVVQKIDQSVENPRLLLKDMTDSIEATMHSDIPLAHPNVLEPGVVILLRDAGLLGFRGSKKCPGPQYHLMIAPRNVLAVYSEKTRLVSSPWMDSMKKTAGTSTDDETTDIFGEKVKNDENFKKILSERNPLFSDSRMEISDFESDEDDMAFTCFKLGDINNSEMATSFSKIPKNFPVSKNLEKEKVRKNHFFEVEKSEIGQCTKKSPKIVARKSPSDVNVEKTEESMNEGSRSVEVEIRPKTTPRIKLQQFRSKDVLTPTISVAKVAETSPSISVDIDNSTEDNKEKSDSIMEFIEDDLLASDDDTEDEILSQLDVDSIMTNYNAGS